MNALILTKLQKLPSFEFCLWLYIILNSNKAGIFTQTNKEIANFFNRHYGVISQTISRMAKKGLFEVNYGFRGSREIIVKMEY